MRPINRISCTSLLALTSALASAVVYAHSASDAYLTLTEPAAATSGNIAQTVIHGQWDIALRDLDFVMKLDDNGDGEIVWGELRNHQPAIADYAYRALDFSGDHAKCRIVPLRQLVDDHADGAYASLMFDIQCNGRPKRLAIDYRLFFAIDPSHRAILVFRNGDNIATSVLSVDKRTLEFER